MTNAMIPYEKEPDPSGEGRTGNVGKASVQGLEYVELDGGEYVLYTSQGSSDQLLLSVMWSVLLGISVMLLALGMFSMDLSIRLILGGGFALCSLLLCGQLYRYYKWDRDSYVVLTDRNIYTNVLYCGRVKLPPTVIAVERILRVETGFQLGRGHRVSLELPAREDATMHMEIRFGQAEEFHNFVDIFEEARKGGQAE